MITPESETPIRVGHVDIMELIGGTNGGFVDDLLNGVVREGFNRQSQRKTVAIIGDIRRKTVAVIVSRRR